MNADWTMIFSSKISPQHSRILLKITSKDEYYKVSEQEIQIWPEVGYALEMYNTDMKINTQPATLTNYQKLIDSV